MATNKRVLELPSDDEGGDKKAGAQEKKQDQDQQLLCFFCAKELITLAAGTSAGELVEKK